jgi:L-phenylalanine/L-methionine N-acetyltransferase
VIGQLGLHTAASLQRRHAGGIGMAVRDDWQGQGVSSALLHTATDLADRWLGLTRLELTVYTDNAPAIGLYEKFGFVREGLHRRYAYRDGAWADVYAVARFRDDLP